MILLRCEMVQRSEVQIIDGLPAQSDTLPVKLVNNSGSWALRRSSVQDEEEDEARQPHSEMLLILRTAPLKSIFYRTKNVKASSLSSIS